MNAKEDIYGLSGYAMLVQAFVDGKLPVRIFQPALIRLWSADRDLEWAMIDGQITESDPEPGRHARAEQELKRACTAQTNAEELARTWAAIWAWRRRRAALVAKVLDLLHRYVALYTPISELRAENSKLHVDEPRLRDFMMPLRDVLECITEEGVPPSTSAGSAKP
jgi:hypothetical protein